MLFVVFTTDDVTLGVLEYRRRAVVEMVLGARVVVPTQSESGHNGNTDKNNSVVMKDINSDISMSIVIIR